MEVEPLRRATLCAWPDRFRHRRVVVRYHPASRGRRL